MSRVGRFIGLVRRFIDDGFGIWIHDPNPTIDATSFLPIQMIINAMELSLGLHQAESEGSLHGPSDQDHGQALCLLPVCKTDGPVSLSPPPPAPVIQLQSCPRYTHRPYGGGGSSFGRKAPPLPLSFGVRHSSMDKSYKSTNSAHKATTLTRSLRPSTTAC